MVKDMDCSCCDTWPGSLEGGMEVVVAATASIGDEDRPCRDYKPRNDDHHQQDHSDHHHHLDSMARYPPWLGPMLSTPFFIQCTRPHHHQQQHDQNASAGTTAAPPSTKATECNMFCLDCSAAICPVCVPSHRRAGHRTVQIRRSSYHDVVRVGEIQRFLDVSGVQTYVINSARVVFLNERPQTKGAKGGEGSGGGGSSRSANACEVCRRMLLDSFGFCSLGCKVAGTTKSNKRKHQHHHHVTDNQLELGESDSEEGSCTTTDGGSDNDNTAYQRFAGGVLYGKALPQAAAAASNNTSMTTRKRRKGVPQRAPFGTTLAYDYGYWY